MLPIILVSQTRAETKKYLSEFLRKHPVHPARIFSVEKEKQSITIDQIREIGTLFQRADDEMKLVVIYDFDTARTEAQNAFLKTLEEKNQSAQFILVVENSAYILPTIRSRAQTVKLSVKKDREFKQMKALGLLDNQLSLEQSLLATARLAKDKAPRLINELIAYLHLLITENHYHKNIPLVFDQAIETKKLIEKNNVNPEFALDILLSHCFSAGILPADLDLG